jgi:alpha-amylase
MPYNIKAWTKFLYTARAGKYSTFTYNKSHFNGTDWNEKNKKRAIYRFAEDGKNWMQDVGTLQGNADYLMLENLDYTNPALVQEVTEWGEWIVEELDLNGFRLDAVQHYSWNFANKWTKHLKEAFKQQGKPDLLFVGEFWHGDVRELTGWLDNMHDFFRLYDVPLMYNIAKLSQFERTDLRQVFDGSLVQIRPEQAVVSFHKMCVSNTRNANLSTDIYPMPRHAKRSIHGHADQPRFHSTRARSHTITTRWLPLRVLRRFIRSWSSTPRTTNMLG